jgi:cytochrome b involved in lipid metabolism
MHKKIYISALIIIIILLGVGFYGYTTWNTYTPESYIVEDPTTNTITTVNSSTGEITPGGKIFTLEEIKTHGTISSCYSIVNETVYDLTTWVNMHPGGQETILSMCGKDGTQGFMQEHKGKKKFMDILDRFKIGTIAK